MARSKHISSECAQEQKKKIGWNQIITKLNLTWISPCLHSSLNAMNFFTILKKLTPLTTKLNVLILCFLHFTYISIHEHVLIILLLSFKIAIVVNEFFLNGKFLSKFNLKTWFWFIQKNISWNESPKIAKFQILFFSKSSIILW